MILANDNVTVGIVNQATMLLTEEHEVCIGSALDKYEVSMQHGEDDEYEPVSYTHPEPTRHVP